MLEEQFYGKGLKIQQSYVVNKLNESKIQKQFYSPKSSLNSSPTKAIIPSGKFMKP